MRKVLLVSVLLLLCLTTTKAQDFFTVKISGVSSIIVCMIDERSYSYEFNYGRSYGEVEADETGSVTLTLPHHEYEYIAMMPGMKSQHGTFYVHRRNVYFNVRFQPAPEFDGGEVPSTRKMMQEGDSAIREKQYKKARELYRLAAEDGNADGMYKFAFMLKNGVGGKKDKLAAYYWLERAVEHGHPYAPMRLDNFDQKWRWTLYSVMWGKGGKCIN